MKVGEYVRTDDGLIGKVVSEPYNYKDSIGCDIDFGNNDIYNEYEMYQSIIKSSPNIIDLIEVGDYVNGFRVDRVEKDINYISFGDEKLTLASKFNYDGYAITGEQIKSILTKEQFESMKYKIESKV